jgi:2-polyprenyl-3-methyl-5-hydroxy-6-metoxy-1,4-benzoquinol methylase
MVNKMQTQGAPLNTKSLPTCRFCQTGLEHTFVDLGLSPLANSYVKREALSRPQQFYPLHTRVCANCFLVQLEQFEAPEHIFSDYAYFSSFSDSWLRHAEAYVEQMLREKLVSSASRVVEIASNDGYLLQYFQRRGVSVLGVEPAANVAAEARRKGIPTEGSFFGAESARRLREVHGPADLLVANNVLAHVPGINDFVRGIAMWLAPEGLATLEFPSLRRLIEENQFDTIYHEHFSYLSLMTVRRIFAAHGLIVHDVEELPTHGGSLRIYARPARAQPQETARLRATLQAEEAFGMNRIETYRAFTERVQRTKRRLLAFLIEAREAGKTIAGYGAPAKGNTLLNYCGIRTDFLEFTVDRSPHKQNTWLPGSLIPVRGPEAIREHRPDYLLILPWNLREEIMGQMAFIREWGGRFVTPIPEVKVWP